MTDASTFLIGLVFCAATGWSTTAAEPLSYAVKRISRLQPGIYSREPDANRVCDSGELIIEDTPDGRVQIMLGDNLLIPEVGAPVTEEERGDKWTASSEVSERRILWRKDGVFGGKAMHWEKLILVHNTGFIYTHVYEGKSVTCNLTRR